MDSLISQPDAPSEEKKIDTETPILVSSEPPKDAESHEALANGDSEEPNENGKADSTSDTPVVNNIEEVVGKINNNEITETNVESTGDETIIQKENSDQTDKTDASEDISTTDDYEEKSSESDKIDSTTEENDQEMVEAKHNDVDEDSSKLNGSSGEPMIAEQCIVEPDLPIFDVLNETHVETEDSPMDYCEVISDKDVNLEAPDEQERSQDNGGGEAIIKNFLPVAPSVPRRKSVNPKSKKHNGKKKSDIVHTISDDSDSDSASSTEGTNVDELKDNIEKLIKVQKPKVLSTEEEEFKQRSYGSGPRIQFARIHCTACNKHIGSALSKQKDRYIHPLLKVLVCKSCYNFYTSGDFEKDEDGSELYCRWCGQGGKVICCSKCAFVFCTKCITRNCGIKRLQQIKSIDDWLCFACNPSPLMKFQVQCTALIEYLRDEMTRLSALGLDNTNLYRMDYSNCCSNRKRRSKDRDFNIEEELNFTKRPRSSKSKANAEKPLLNTQEEEEVVCAPDLLSFIGEDDQAESINLEDVTVEKPAYSRSSPPPLQPRPTPLPKVPILNNYRFIAPVILPKNAMFVQNPVRNTVIVQTPPVDPKPKPSLVHNPASMVKSNKGKQIVLNTTLKNPITTQNIGNLTSSVEKVSTHKITLKTPNQNLPKLVPGLKYEWFDSASKSSLDIQSKLSFNIAELSVEKQRASTMEDLATIHNRFQEVLSKSINSMIQIRRTLRNDFLSSLNQLKFIRNVQEQKEDDDDVVFVNSTSPSNSAPLPKECITIDDKPHGPYLKVRSVSQLHNVPSDCITIPDEVIEKISENKKEENAKKLQEQEKPNETVVNTCDISNDSNKENVESFTTNTIEIEDDERENSVEVHASTSKKDDSTHQIDSQKTGPENAELTPEAQKAVFESKIEELVRDNLKYNETYVDVEEPNK